MFANLTEPRHFAEWRTGKGSQVSTGGTMKMFATSSDLSIPFESGVFVFFVLSHTPWAFFGEMR